MWPSVSSVPWYMMVKPDSILFCSIVKGSDASLVVWGAVFCVFYSLPFTSCYSLPFTSCQLMTRPAMVWIKGLNSHLIVQQWIVIYYNLKSSIRCSRNMQHMGFYVFTLAFIRTLLFTFTLLFLFFLKRWRWFIEVKHQGQWLCNSIVWCVNKCYLVLSESVSVEFKSDCIR